MAVTDLKYKISIRYAPELKKEGIANAHRQTYLFSNNGLSPPYTHFDAVFKDTAATTRSNPSNVSTNTFAWHSPN